MNNMSTNLSLEQELPQKPSFPTEVWDKCRKDKDFMPILFEWYKHIGVMCNILASVSRSSPAIRKMPALHYAILTGLLNRCSRLMLSNVRLSVTNKYGETTRLLDRSIIESAVIVQWLCHKDSDDCFQRYLADGIKSDLKLKDHIQQNIAERGGDALVIENSMLSSIQECLDSTKLSEKQIRQMKPLPDLWSMCRDIRLSVGFYIGTQRMGSHEVHGTWTSLRSHYLRQDEHGEYYLRDHNVRPHENQFMVIPIVILETLKRFMEYVVPNATDREPIESILAEATAEIGKLTSEIVGPDFEFDPDSGSVQQ
ncbi:hypothetical protein ES703_97871 [subsurface metagenome]